MKKIVSPKSEKVILRTHPIVSNAKGWYIKVVETSNEAFYVEATDYYGRIVSKQGSNSSNLQREIEKAIKENQEL
jgi:hypothetical protein